MRRLAHQNIAVAIAEAGREGEVRNHGIISSDLHAVEKLLRKLGHPGKELRVCYEAGPCGVDSVASSGSLTLALRFKAAPVVAVCLAAAAAARLCWHGV